MGCCVIIMNTPAVNLLLRQMCSSDFPPGIDMVDSLRVLLCFSSWNRYGGFPENAPLLFQLE